MFIQRRFLILFCLQLFACSLWFSSCTTIDLYERVVPIPGHQWRSNYQPQFSFEIRDTAVPYEAFVILRHNNRYRYNNIWVNLATGTGADSLQKIGLELPLANKQGWLGIGMGDAFEHRVRIGNEIQKLGFVTLAPEGFYFNRAGTYTFTLEQIMRDDPLAEVMNVGLRLEKKTR
jgi:gliding motility-associated lipoprotein GldH